MTPPPRPRGSTAAKLFGLCAVLFFLTPVTLLGAVALLPVHGDGFGTLLDALVLALVCFVLAVLVLLLAVAVAWREHRRPTRPDAEVATTVVDPRSGPGHPRRDG